MNTQTNPSTHTEPLLRTWAAELRRLNGEIKVAVNKTKANIAATIREKRAQHDAARKALNQRIAAQIEQWAGELDQLDAELVAATLPLHPDLLAADALAVDLALAPAEHAREREAPIAALRASEMVARQQLQESLLARLRELEAAIETEESRITANATLVRDRLNIRLEKARQELQRLAEAERSAWRSAMADADQALDALAADLVKELADFD